VINVKTLNGLSVIAASGFTASPAAGRHLTQMDTMAMRWNMK
jgi:hypothetical protein